MGFELELTVTISYAGPKASIHTPEDADVAIRGDLTALGIPHPKRSNVSIVYPGTVRFYWTAAPHSAIRKKLTSSLQPPHNMEQEKIFKERYIKRIDLKESKAKPGSNQAPKPNSNSNDPSKAQTELPFHFLPNPDASFSAIPMSGYSPEQILPPRTSEKGKEKENGDDSDDVVAMENGGVPPLSLSQRPFSVMKVKPEPTEVPIPAVSAWNYNSSGKVEPMGDVDMPPVRVVGSWNSAEWVRPPETEPNEGEKWAYSRPLRNSSEWVKPPEAKHREADNWSDSQPLWRFKRRSPRWADSRYGAEMEPSRHSLSASERTRYPEADEERVRYEERYYDPRPYPKPQYSNQYQLDHRQQQPPAEPLSEEKRMLRSELAHARRKLNAEIQRERDVVQRLRDLGEGNEIPEGYNDDFVMRARIQQIEEELQAERVRRQELERIVEDIRRECRTPFVVPAILEAFLEISELTNDVLEGIHVDG